MRKIFLLLFILLFITGCHKNIVTKDLFLETADKKGYVVQNNRSGYENYDYIQEIYYAIERENAYDIQFLELKNDDYAKRFFDVNQQELLKLVDPADTYVKAYNESLYSVYHIENSTKYMLVIRYKNNILYIDAPINYINDIEDFLNAMDLDF